MSVKMQQAMLRFNRTVRKYLLACASQRLHALSADTVEKNSFYPVIHTNKQLNLSVPRTFTNYRSPRPWGKRTFFLPLTPLDH
jgi:hypothetical protein